MQALKTKLTLRTIVVALITYVIFAVFFDSAVGIKKFFDLPDETIVAILLCINAILTILLIRGNNFIIDSELQQTYLTLKLLTKLQKDNAVEIHATNDTVENIQTLYAKYDKEKDKIIILKIGLSGKEQYLEEVSISEFAKYYKI